jgi:3-isopropylmalate dehydrogenase
MSKVFKILILPGDGIGPEVMAEVSKLMQAVEKSSGVKFETTFDDIGGAAYERYGSPLDKTTLDTAKQSHAVLLGAVGGEKWDNLEFSLKPEQGLLRIRK